MPVSTKKKLTFALILTVAALLLGVAVIEIVLRARYGKIERITGAAEWRVAEVDGVVCHWDAYDANLGWTNRPGYRSDERVPFRVTINSQGLRGEREYSRASSPGPSTPGSLPPGFRIAMFGDSTIFGEEVHNDHTVPAYLERRIAGAEVLNFGVHGYSFGQMMLRMEAEAFDYQPHHIIVAVAPHGHWGPRVNCAIAAWIADHLLRRHGDWRAAPDAPNCTDEPLVDQR